MNKRVYVSGPVSKGCLKDNIQQANDAFIALVDAGLNPLVPHWSCYSGQIIQSVKTYIGDKAYGEDYVYSIASPTPNKLTHEDWMRVDLAWVSASECVLRLPGESRGADEETSHAKALGIPVFYNVQDVVNWCNQCHAGESSVV